MSLFKRSENQPQEPNVVNDNTPQPTQGHSVEDIVAGVMKQIMPLIQQPPVQQVQQPVVEEEEEQLDPSEVKKFNKILEQYVNNSVMPYANAFDSTVPEMVRDRAVSKLTPGQKVIYQKYQHEVNDLMNKKVGNNPRAQASVDTHMSAIEMILGRHSDEIESLSLRNATAEDVPHLIPPSSGATVVDTEPQLDENNKIVLSGYQTYSGRFENWTPKTYDYYKNIPKGSVMSMVAYHRAKLAQQGENK